MTVMRIDEHLQTLVPRMQELEEAGLLPGARVTVDEVDGGVVRLAVAGREVELARAVAAEVYVSV